MKISTRKEAIDAVKTSFWAMGFGAFLWILLMLGDGSGGVGGLTIGGATVPIPIPAGGNPFDLLLALAGLVFLGLGVGLLGSGIYWLIRHR